MSYRVISTVTPIRIPFTVLITLLVTYLLTVLITLLVTYLLAVHITLLITYILRPPDSPSIGAPKVEKMGFGP